MSVCSGPGCNHSSHLTVEDTRNFKVGPRFVGVDNPDAPDGIEWRQVQDESAQVSDAQLHAVSERLGLVESEPETPKRELIEMGSEGWQERAALQVRAFGTALLRDHAGITVYDPLKKLPADIGAYAKRNCSSCYGRGFVRRAFGRLHTGEMAWQERACGCTNRRKR